MRRTFIVTLLILISALVAFGQRKAKRASGNSAAAEQVRSLDRQWFDAYIANNADGIAAVEADDIVVTNPDGTVSDKQQDVSSMRSGELKFTSGSYDEAQVKVFGDTAIVTGRITVKGTYKGQDISGSYRFTDVFARRNGRWQAVAAQATAIAPPPATRREGQ